MALFQAFNISASGMAAERFRTDIIAENIANVNTTSTESGNRKRCKSNFRKGRYGNRFRERI